MIEYTVVTRPFYREQQPVLYTVLDNSVGEAASRVMNYRDVKEILDVKLSNEIVWDDETMEKYWVLYK